MNGRNAFFKLGLIALFVLSFAQGMGQVCHCNYLLSPRESFAAATIESNTNYNRAFLMGGKDASGTILSHGERLTGSVQCLYPTATFPLPAGPNFGASGIYSTSTNKVYLFGGNNGTSDLATVWEMDPTSLVWTAKAPMSVPRSFAAVVEINGLLYISGGRNGATVLSSHEAYNPVTNTWVPKAPLPTPTWGHKYLRSALNAWPMTFPYAHILGGRNQLGTYMNQNLQYNPVSDAWTAQAPMPSPLAFFAGMSAYLTQGNGIYLAVIGGESSPGTVTSAISIYDPISNTWPPLGSNLYPCYAASHYEAIQTGDLIDLYISHMSMGGRMNGGPATNEMSLLGFWAVLDEGDINLSVERAPDSNTLIWDYAGQGQIQSLVLQARDGEGAFQVVESLGDCAANCGSGQHRTIGDFCKGPACEVRLSATLVDGSRKVSNVVEIGRIGLIEPIVTLDADRISVEMPFGLEGNFVLLDAKGTVLKKGELAQGIVTIVDVSGQPKGVYFFRVQTSSGSFSKRFIF